MNENMNIEKITDKVKKLLRLSNSDNEHEAILAFNRAQELMAKYKIEISDTKEDVSIIKKVTPLYVTKSRNLYRVSLVQNLEKYFCCEDFMTRKSDAPRKYNITLIGTAEDVEVFESLLIFADEHINKWFKNWKDSVNTKVLDGTCTNKQLYSISTQYNFKETYGNSFAKGLRDKLEEKLNDHKDWGLVMTTPDEAIDL